MKNPFTNDDEPSYIIRQKNIKHIFTTTIHLMEVVIEKYDYCFTRLYYHSKGKTPYSVIHQRALFLTLKLLS